MINFNLLKRQLSNSLRAGACLKTHHSLYVLVILVRAAGMLHPLLPDQSPEPPVERSQENYFSLQRKEVVTAAAADAMCLYTNSLVRLFCREREVTDSHSVS